MGDLEFAGLNDLAGGVYEVVNINATGEFIEINGKLFGNILCFIHLLSQQSIVDIDG